MKIFRCGHCDHALFFENNLCENCNHLTGYRDTDRKMLTFNPDNNSLISDREGITYKYCKNKEHDACNWLIDLNDPHDYCSACQLNRTIPNLSDFQNLGHWKNLEIAKHRLIYQLQKIGLPLHSKLVNKEGFCFDFVAQENGTTFMTGHADGVITILLREADSVKREQTRKQFEEPYRTLIGHLRHEVGHYFWNRLILSNQQSLNEFRTAFGDERLDYSEALQDYYSMGAPNDWQESFISKYATAHPFEDWAETWAHYLHIMSMVETAYFFGMSIKPLGTAITKSAKVTFDPYMTSDFSSIIETCVPLSFAVNSINRAMGVPDVYPFVISQPIVDKLFFIHKLLLPFR